MFTLNNYGEFFDQMLIVMKSLLVSLVLRRRRYRRYKRSGRLKSFILISIAHSSPFFKINFIFHLIFYFQLNFLYAFYARKDAKNSVDSACPTHLAGISSFSYRQDNLCRTVINCTFAVYIETIFDFEAFTEAELPVCKYAQ